MADDFQVGDVVVCVDAKPRHNTVPGIRMPIEGRFYRVRAVNVVPTTTFLDVSGEKTPGRVIEGGKGFLADRFRKLPKADEQFTQRIRACKPHRNRVPA